MIKIIGVRFKSGGKVYYFNPNGLSAKKDEYVVVETARGIEMGKVVIEEKEISEENINKPLKDVIRVATAEDIAISKANSEKEKEAYAICLEKIRNHNLEMKLVEVEYTFDGSKILFYFTAEG